MKKIALMLVGVLVFGQACAAVDLATFWPARAPIAWKHLGKTDQANYYYGVYDDPPWGTVLVVKSGQFSLTGGYSVIELDDFRFRCKSNNPPENVGVLLSQTFDSDGNLLNQIADENNGMLATPIRPHTILADAVIGACKLEGRRETDRDAQNAYDQKAFDTLNKMKKTEVAKALECYGVAVNKVEQPVLPIPGKDACSTFLRAAGLDPNKRPGWSLRPFELIAPH